MESGRISTGMGERNMRPQSNVEAIRSLTSTVLKQEEIINQMAELAGAVIEELSQYRSVEAEERILGKLTEE